VSPVISTRGGVSAGAYGWGAAAGGAVGAYESIATANGNGSSTTITFSSIASTFTHLQIRGIPSATSGGLGGATMTLNGDTGNNYTLHQISANGATITGSGYGTGQAFMWIGINSASFNTGLPVTIIDILDYASTSKNKTVRSFSGTDNNGSGQIRINGNSWMNTAAITSITLKNEDGVAWATGATFALYGIKAAA
jgi:hypothetical protein